MDRLINSKIGVNLAFGLARTVPPRLGYAIASLAARWISSRRSSPSVRAVRANQWVVSGEQADRETLDQSVRAVFKHSARSVYDLYHYIQDLKTAGRLFHPEPSFQELMDRPRFDQHGLIVVGLHMSGFDLALQWFASNLHNPLALTIPNPQGGRQLEFEIRYRTGLNLVPGSLKGLRQAIQYLEQGGIVVTGIDRPLEDSHLRPRFFGRPAPVPTHHILLALKAQVPVRITFSRLEADGKYHLSVSPPIRMDPYPNRTDEMLFNAEKVLAVAERFILQNPQQWLIFLPVWPEILDQAPQ